MAAIWRLGKDFVLDVVKGTKKHGPPGDPVRAWNSLRYFFSRKPAAPPVVSVPDVEVHIPDGSGGDGSNRTFILIAVACCCGTGGLIWIVFRARRN